MKKNFFLCPIIFMFFLIVANVVAGEIVCYSDYDCVRGFVGKEFCSNNDVYKNFLNSSCINPGTEESYCSNTTNPVFLIDCGNDEFGEWSEDYCKGSDVYRSRTNVLRQCKIVNQILNISGCFSEIFFQEELVQYCLNGCENGKCLDITCSSDLDCGIDEYSELFCQNDSVQQNFTRYICVNPGRVDSYCSNITITRLNKSCYSEQICYNAQCLDISCRDDDQCGIDSFVGNFFCKNKDVYRDYKEYRCLNPGTLNSSCSFDIVSRFIESCEYRCKDGRCYSKSTVYFSDYVEDEPSYSYQERLIPVYYEENQTVYKIYSKSELENRTLSWNVVLALIVLIITISILIVIIILIK